MESCPVLTKTVSSAGKPRFGGRVEVKIVRNEEKLVSKSQDTDTLEANKSNRTTRTSKAHSKHCFLSFFPCCLKPSLCGKLSSLTKTVSPAGEPQFELRAEAETVPNEERPMGLASPEAWMASMALGPAKVTKESSTATGREPSYEHALTVSHKSKDIYASSTATGRGPSYEHASSVPRQNINNNASSTRAGQGPVYEHAPHVPRQNNKNNASMPKNGQGSPHEYGRLVRNQIKDINASISGSNNNNNNNNNKKNPGPGSYPGAGTGSVFKSMGESVYAPPHTLAHPGTNTKASSFQGEQGLQQKQQQQQQQSSPEPMIRDEKKEPEKAPAAVAVAVAVAVVPPQQQRQQQHQQQQQRQSHPQGNQRVWNEDGWWEPSHTSTADAARKEDMRQAFRHVLRF